MKNIIDGVRVEFTIEPTNEHLKVLRHLVACWKNDNHIVSKFDLYEMVYGIYQNDEKMRRLEVIMDDLMRSIMTFYSEPMYNAALLPARKRFSLYRGGIQEHYDLLGAPGVLTNFYKENGWWKVVESSEEDE